MKTENRYTKSLSIIFITFLIIVFILNISTKDKDFSDSENRVLAKKTKFSLERLFDGRYINKYEKYKVDQFVGRDFFVSIKSNVDLLLGKRDSNGVYLGKNGYLLEDFKPLDDIKTNTDALNNFATKYKNINNYIAVIPNAISILENKLPKFAPVTDQRSYLNNFSNSLNNDITYIDTFNVLNDNKNDYIYYKTDNHWTSVGAYISFLEIKDKMKLNGNDIKPNPRKISNNFNGTLSSKSGFRLNEKDDIYVYLPNKNNSNIVVNFTEKQKKSSSLYNVDSISTKDKYSLFLEGNHPILEINTTANTSNQLLLIKDSYANAFIPFLTDHYTKIIVIDPRYYYGDIDKLIENNNITDTLFLYNANTFFCDTSLAPVLNNE